MKRPGSLAPAEWLLVVLLFVLAAVGLFCGGCATMRQTCRYECGALVEQTTRSMVVGTGETELASDACAALSYSTQDTGLSDNGRLALGTVAEGAARGAVGAMIPSPRTALGR